MNKKTTIAVALGALAINGAVGFGVYKKFFADPSLKTDETHTEVASALPPTSTPQLPFVGKRSFDFMGGSGTGYSIQIEASGHTTVTQDGTQQSSVEYRGPFANPLRMGASGGLLFKDGKVFSLTAQGQPETGCMGDGPCASDLFDPKEGEAKAAMYSAAVETALTDENAILCRYNESENVCSEFGAQWHLQPLPPNEFAARHGFVQVDKTELIQGARGTYLKISVTDGDL